MTSIKWLLISLAVSLMGLLALYYSTRSTSFEYDAWRDNTQHWTGETRYRMRYDVLRELQPLHSGEAVIALLGEPDRGGIKSSFLTYRIGRHRNLFGLLSDTYWLTIVLKDEKVVNLSLHPD